MTKKMLHAEWDMPIDAAIDAEAEAQAVCMQTEDFAVLTAPSRGAKSRNSRAIDL